jgi:hypothetical protein
VKYPIASTTFQISSNDRRLQFSKNGVKFWEGVLGAYLGFGIWQLEIDEFGSFYSRR